VYCYVRGERNKNFDKYRLSQMNPHAGMVLQTDVDDQCDKLTVDRRRYVTDNDRVYHADTQTPLLRFVAVLLE